MLKLAAIQSLIAHGIAAVLANVLKHLIGRPRPKFVHSGDWQMAISWISGLDSFPSGHSTASFAVATVLTKRFPTWGPLCMGLAAFVALSRVLRGSHFPTDVVGGAVVGILSGSIAAAPLKEWRTSVQQGCRDAAIGSSLVLAVAVDIVSQDGRWLCGPVVHRRGGNSRDSWVLDPTDLLAIQGLAKGNLVVEGLALSDCVWASRR